MMKILILIVLRSLTIITACIIPTTYACAQQPAKMVINSASQALWLDAKEGNVKAEDKIALILYSEKKYDKSLFWYSQAAEQGDVKAEVFLGDAYYNGKGEPKYYPMAIHWWKKAAKSGDIIAEDILRNFYKSMTQEQAKKLAESDINGSHYDNQIILLQAAKNGDTAAQYEAGKLFSTQGKYSLANHWYKLAAEKGFAASQNALGNAYFHGRGIDKNYNKAAYWWKKSANQGNNNAKKNLCILYYTLGYSYAHGLGVSIDYVTSDYWYYEAAALDDPAAASALGNVYYYGHGVKKNYTIAALWWHIATYNDEANAANVSNHKYNQKKLLKKFHQALHSQPTKNVEQAYTDVKNYSFKHSFARPWNIAARQGIKNAENMLGFVYAHGLGVPKNYATTDFWYKKAAVQGVDVSQDALGNAYFNGKGLNKNYKTAVYWWSKAAKQQNVHAQNSLGYAFAHGKGVPKNYKVSDRWYRKAAEQGDAIAQYKLGNAYNTGKGVAVYYPNAIYWWKKAAVQGISNAQTELGDAYYHGQIVRRSIRQANYWWDVAAAQGNIAAIKDLTAEKNNETFFDKVNYWHLTVLVITLAILIKYLLKRIRNHHQIKIYSTMRPRILDHFSKVPFLTLKEILFNVSTGERDHEYIYKIIQELIESGEIVKLFTDNSTGEQRYARNQAESEIPNVKVTEIILD